MIPSVSFANAHPHISKQRSHPLHIPKSDRTSPNFKTAIPSVSYR
ncbi:MAG: hypothetical protein ACKPEO_27955 [Sphaerospermopsis kisseleviana]|nr:MULTISPECIES: hypothetical protein [Sphaerospermopsis]